MDHKNNVDLHSLLSDLDDNNVEIERARDMLQLFDEHLDSELEVLRKEKQWATEYFLNRFHLLRSLLDAIEIQLSDTAVSMAETLQKGYDIYHAAKI